MGEVVNLRRARKTKTRGAKAAQASANRVAFGRTGAEKANDREGIARRERALDAAKLE